MTDPQPVRKNPLRFVVWTILAALFVFYIFPRLLMAWPPDWIERRTQRRLILERIESVGGWNALKRECMTLVGQHTNEPFEWFRYGDTNALPPTLAALKPMEIRFYPPGIFRGSQQDTSVPVVHIRIFGMPSTGGNASPYLGLEVVCSTNTGAYEPRRGYSGGVPGNRHSTFRKVAENVFEIY
ncbi:MAG: hypothetical protein ACTHLW_20080 [Verrucomicrobiota bacterium]